MAIYIEAKVIHTQGTDGVNSWADMLVAPTRDHKSDDCCFLKNNLSSAHTHAGFACFRHLV